MSSTTTNASSKTLLVYGHKGWIGKQFVEILKKQTNFNFVLGTARCDNVEDTESEIDRVKPTHVVTFIGRTHGTIGTKKYTTIDYLEQKGKLTDNVRDNLFAPISLAMMCKERSIHYTYLGTGCIFSYKKDDPKYHFNEKDLPNFFGSGYSCVKGFTDRLMHQFEKNVLNLRIRMPIVGYDNQRNFVTKIKTYAKIISVPNSMTVLPELLPIALDLMSKGVTGTINMTNPGAISHNEIMELYRKHVDPTFTWTNFTIEEQNKILAAERSNNTLDTTRLESLSNVKPIKESVEELMKSYVVDPSFVRRGGDAASTTKDSSENKGSELASTKEAESSSLPDSADTIVFVTGGAGFIGSHFVNHLHATTSSLKIINFDALYYCASVENVNASVRADADRYSFIEGNLQSLDLLNHIFKTNKITHVVHFAAQSHVQNSFSDALQYTRDNVLGTHNLLESCRVHGTHLTRFVHVSTDEVYGESPLGDGASQKTEATVLCPTNPYAATKAAAELIAQSYYHSFKMPIIITRGNNVYGPRQYPEKLIPKFIKLLREGKQVTIQGDGSCVRGFLHVYDTAEAFSCVLRKGLVGEIYNIGCDEDTEHSVLDVAKMLIGLIKGAKSDADVQKWITYIADRPFNDKRYYISNAKLKALGWSIKVGFKEGVRELALDVKA